MEKASIKDLIARKLQKDSTKTKYHEIYVKSLDKIIMIKHPSDEQRMDMADEIGDYSDTRTMVKAYSRLIYNCCPLLQEPELQQSLEIVDPFDTVMAIFDLDDVMDIGEKLMNAMETIGENVKNS